MKAHKKRVIINAHLKVENIKKLSPNLIRIYFSSDKTLPVDPEWIGPHIKLLFPHANNDSITFPEVDENNKINWQEGLRERVRTYSIRQFNKADNQLTIDFVVHQLGIATTWAQNAKRGDQIGLIGMGSKCKFSDNNLENHLLVLIGDITALPSVAYTIENLPNNKRAVAFIEVANVEERELLKNSEKVILSWIIRETGQPSKLVDKVMENIPFNNENLFFWGGMESSLAQSLRHALKERYTDLVDHVQIISYWREGFTEGNFSHRD